MLDYESIKSIDAGRIPHYVKKYPDASGLFTPFSLVCNAVYSILWQDMMFYIPILMQVNSLPLLYQ